VCVSDAALLDEAGAAVERIVDQFDRACSRFRADSELVACNEAAGRAVRVSPLLLDSIEAALRAAALTDGDVDPTVGQALITLGYDQDFAALAAAHAPSENASLRVSVAAVPGWRTVDVDRSARTVRIPRGVTLDLGATAKALAADRAAEEASAATGAGVLVGLGGDFAIAGPVVPPGWRIRVTDDHRADVRAGGQWILLKSGGLATSGTTVRRWSAGDGTVHHVVDPSSGRPAAEVWRTVSVTASCCVDANIASTAAIVRGERAAEWLTSLALPSRLVRVDGTVVHLAGWPVGGDDLPPAIARSADTRQTTTSEVPA